MKDLLQEKIDYSELGGKEQENYNYAKTAAKLAEFGFSCCLITADKHGADMIAYHIKSGNKFSIQLKGSRATLDKKYKDKDIWIAYTDRKTNEICLYEHDLAMERFEQGPSALSESWRVKGGYSGTSLYTQFDDLIIRLPLS
jgi:hypothetical protein